MLLGDRFFRLNGEWLDIATGWEASLRRLDQEEARRLSIAFVAGDCSTDVLDVFRAGTDGWWIAERFYPGPELDRRERARAFSTARSFAQGVSAASWTGIRLIRLDLTLQRHGEDDDRIWLVSAAAHVLRDVGFVVLRPGLTLQDSAKAGIHRRHVAMALLSESDRRALPGWITALTARSPRGHLVLDARPEPDPISAGPIVRERSSIVRRTRSRFGEVRWRGVRTTPAGGRAMLVESIPHLVEIAHEAEDERGALRAMCAWARRQRGVAAVGFFLPVMSRAIAADGTVLAGHDDLFAAAIAAEEPHTFVREAVALHVHPVRYSGSRIGVVIVRGMEEERETILRVGQTLSALGAPALRTCSDERAAADDPDLAREILGRSPAMAAVRQTIARVAGAPFAVLIEGASGTGKELVARAIHRLSPRRDRRFSAVNCAAFTDELLEAELFGHTRGAFTGAVAARPGLFEDAHLGTVFLDEVGELSPRAQAKLLRVLQEREVRRVGENGVRPVDVRVVAATNRPLAKAVRQRLFRDDLLFRLAVVRIRLPRLAERVEDIPVLAFACWRQVILEVGKRATLGADAVGALCRHSWPGNVRELQNVLAAMAVLAPACGRVRARHVHAVLSGTSSAEPEDVVSLESARRLCERRTIARALARHGGRRSAAARELGVTRQGLAKAMRRVGLVGSRPESAA